MALLASSWLLIESFVIPHGLLKWFYLSFYIHPVFLVFCQVFLWINQLMKLLIWLFYPLTLVFNLPLSVFGSIKRVIVHLFSYIIRPTKSDIFYDALEPDVAENISSADFAIVVSCKMSLLAVNDGVDETIEEMNHSRCVQDSWLNDYLYSDHYTASIMIYDFSMSSESVVSMPSFRLSFVDQSLNLRSSYDHVITNDQDDQFDHGDTEEAPDPLLLTDSPNDSVWPISSFDAILDGGCDLPLTQQSVTVDQFQHKYESRMKFFNILYHERLQGINAISNELLSSSPSLFDCIEATDCPVQYKTWSKMAKKRLMRSLECDLEMICVAQSCLFWEALDHQFHKVESIVLSDVGGKILLLFKDDISGRFQDVQIQLERFVEDERCDGHGSSSRNNTSKRLSFQGLLQVPDVTGSVVMKEENQMMSEEYCIRPSQLLEAIDNCIKAFWSYIKTDDRKSFWKCKEFWRTNPSVEDPQDLELLYHVVKTLEKKWVMLRVLQGKSKCWVRRKVKPVQAEDEKRNIMFSMIDLNLVQRLLQISFLSKSHLMWCQLRLQNLDFVQDRVVRGRHITHLFPSS